MSNYEDKNRQYTDNRWFGNQDRSTGQAIARDAYHAAGHFVRGVYRGVTGNFDGAKNDFKRSWDHACGENTREAHKRNSPGKK